MTKGIISACVAVVVLFILPSTAVATVYPNERPLNDPMISALIIDAHQYHNQRTAGTHCIPETTIVTVVDDILRWDGPVMYRAAASAVLVKSPRHPCKIIFNGFVLARSQTKMQSKSWRAWTTFDSNTHLPFPRWYAARLCRVVYHEVGHNEGLAHTETGLMRPGSVDIPVECINWARKMVPRPKRT